MEKKINRVKEREVFHNQYGRLYNDQVITSEGQIGTYLRWSWAEEGVVIVPFRGNRIALAAMYRYPIGAFSLEFPRGSKKPGEAIVKAALRELEEEFSLSGVNPTPIGYIYPDSGLIEQGVWVVQIEVNDPDFRNPNKQEKMEAIQKPQWVEIVDMKNLILNGQVRCSITISSFALFLMARSAPL